MTQGPLERERVGWPGLVLEDISHFGNCTLYRRFCHSCDEPSIALCLSQCTPHVHNTHITWLLCTWHTFSYLSHILYSDQCLAFVFCCHNDCTWFIPCSCCCLASLFLFLCFLFAHLQWTKSAFAFNNPNTWQSFIRVPISRFLSGNRNKTWKKIRKFSIRGPICWSRVTLCTFLRHCNTEQYTWGWIPTIMDPNFCLIAGIAATPAFYEDWKLKSVI